MPETNRKRNIAYASIGGIVGLALASMIPGVNIVALPLAIKTLGAVASVAVGGLAWQDVTKAKVKKPPEGQG